MNMLRNINQQALLHKLKDESGQDLIEYALVAAFIGLAAVVSLRSLAQAIGAIFSIGPSLAATL